ncbi:uncharacterized protein LOC115445656 [Manduca sexta]|uniref:Uncharacterized protein n=1 Tax=Manduca sexta TaxID=7130 RepID=A0A922CPJ2_MANSE|nr:uncharacterized protein LOC115445656 [Manduca sexta]KAG6453531.1 hypothetical protein O3G_MSEX008181 [Manduca sexta]
MISLLLVCLHTSLIEAAPLQVQLLQPLLQPQQMTLQRQLMALQQLQILKRLNELQNPPLDLPRPLLILLPKNKATIDQVPDLPNLRNQDTKKNHGIEDDERDSVVIDADPTEKYHALKDTPNAILLMPNNGRFSIGDFISSIPFLPIEINVPDSISWIYNGISSIISGIGQRLPFRPQTLDELEAMNQEEGNMRIKSLNSRGIPPVLVIPMGQSFPMYK